MFADFNMTHAKNKVIERDDPGLLEDYQKRSNKLINQARTFVDAGFYNTWDEVYGTTQFNSGDDYKLPEVIK